MAQQHLFTSESVSEGHPDKVADQISDAVLNWALLRERSSKIACEAWKMLSLTIVNDGKLEVDHG